MKTYVTKKIARLEIFRLPGWAAAAYLAATVIFAVIGGFILHHL